MLGKGSGTRIEYKKDKKREELQQQEEDAMRSWRERWEAIWMAVAFAEADDSDYARTILQRRAEDRADQRKRSERRPRPQIYRS